jgi:hypothetical protein
MSDATNTPPLDTETLEAFRERVRNRAIDAFHNSHFTLEALNASLEELDLQPYEPRWVCRSELIITLPVEVNSDDHHAAGDVLSAVLADDDVRAALRTAFAAILADHVDQGIVVRDQPVRLQVGYVDRVMVSDQ